MRFDARPTRTRYQEVPVTTMQEVIRRDYAPR